MTNRSAATPSNAIADLLSTRYFPSSSALCILLLVVVIDIPFRIWTVVDGKSAEAEIFFVAQMILDFLGFILLAVLCMERLAWRNEASTFQPFSYSHILQLAFCTFHTLSAVIGVLGHALYTVDQEGEAGVFANVDFSSSLYFVMINPLLLGVIFSDALREGIWVWWIVCVLTLIVAAVITENTKLSYSISYYFLQSGLVSYIIHQNTRMSHLKEQLMRRDQQLALSAFDTNMKQMLANVAHDLKTPQSSIMAGVELIDLLVTQKLRKLDNGVPIDLQTLQSMLTSAHAGHAGERHAPLDDIDDNVEHQHSNNSFMDMELQSILRTSDSFGYQLRIEVEDQGIGMSAEARQKLFCPFQQHQTLAIGSTGLGLFSLRKRVEALQGQCGVESRTDGTQGSLFWFTIPYRPDHTHEEVMLNRGVQSLSCESDSLEATSGFHTVSGNLKVPSHSFPVTSVSTVSRDSLPTVRARYADSVASLSFDDAFQAVGEDGSKEGDRVLLVDDSPSIIKMTSMLLKKLGYHVTTATNGAMALEVILAKQQSRGCLVVFDVVLMDLQMPIMDGIEAVRRLRASERQWLADHPAAGVAQKGKKHFVLGLSANSTAAISEQTKQAGFDNFLSKPFQVKNFQNLLLKSVD
eukprot:gene30796-37206_t